MDKIYICSPYRGDVAKNIENVKRYCSRVMYEGMPIAPHLYFTQFVDDTFTTDRMRGMQFGLELLKECKEIRVFADEVSEGMIEEIKEALPDIKIMILEPFVLKGTATEEAWDVFRPEVEKRAAKARMIAEKFNLTFIPLQDKFDAAAKLAPADYWLRDGVHPTTEGHELIKREWLKGFERI